MKYEKLQSQSELIKLELTNALNLNVQLKEEMQKMTKEIDDLKARRTNASKEIKKLNDINTQLSGKKDNARAYESDSEHVSKKSNEYINHKTSQHCRNTKNIENEHS